MNDSPLIQIILHGNLDPNDSLIKNLLAILGEKSKVLITKTESPLRLDSSCLMLHVCFDNSLEVTQNEEYKFLIVEGYNSMNLRYLKSHVMGFVQADTILGNGRIFYGIPKVLEKGGFKTFYSIDSGFRLGCLEDKEHIVDNISTYIKTFNEMRKENRKEDLWE